MGVGMDFSIKTMSIESINVLSDCSKNLLKNSSTKELIYSST